MVLPQLADSQDVMQQALMSLGIKNPNEAIDQMNTVTKESPSLQVARALRRFQEALKNGHKVSVQ